MKYEDGLAVWDALRATGVMAFGIETYANSRRMEAITVANPANRADVTWLADGAFKLG
jgi:glycine cleavage system aminomethyltransferase T